MSDIPTDIRAGLDHLAKQDPFPQPTHYPVSPGQYRRFLAWTRRTGKVSFWEFVIERRNYHVSAEVDQGDAHGVRVLLG